VSPCIAFNFLVGKENVIGGDIKSNFLLILWTGSGNCYLLVLESFFCDDRNLFFLVLLAALLLKPDISVVPTFDLHKNCVHEHPQHSPL
jgi:hypothetical protein